MRRRALYSKSGIDYSKAVAGNLWYSDHSFSDSGSVEAGKTPIGVVFANENNRIKILALGIGEVAKIWGASGEIPQLSYLSDSLIESMQTEGAENTDYIVSALGDDSGYAAGYCRRYETEGTSAGDWSLISSNELRMIDGNLSSIESALKASNVPYTIRRGFWISQHASASSAYWRGLSATRYYSADKSTTAAYIIPFFIKSY